MVLSGTAVASTALLSGSAAGDMSGSPTPADADSYDYPTTTTDSDAPVATVYGSFNCPYTEDMVENSFEEIREEFVESGRLTLTFRPLEYDYDGNPWISENGVLAGQAAGGVWAEEPESFWDFFAELWTHMPGDVDEEKLEEIMNDAGVDSASYIADNLEEWDPELQQTSDDAEEEGVEFTPTIELKGDLGNRDDVVEWIEQRLDDEDESDEASEEQEAEAEPSEEEETEEETTEKEETEEESDDASEESDDGSDEDDGSADADVETTTC